MSSRRWHLSRGLTTFAAALGFAASGGFVSAQGPQSKSEAVASAGDAAASLTATAASFLEKHCLACHNAKDKKADLTLEAHRAVDGLVQGRKATDLLLEMVHDGTMPPEDRPRPTTEERDAFVGAVKAILAQSDKHAKVDPGRVTVRRLNRVEYDNTVRDLLFVDASPAQDFPSDDIGHGFDNIGDVLSISPVLMERYLAAAETLAQQAVLVELPKPVKRQQYSRWLEPAGKNLPDKPYRPIAEHNKLHTPFRLGLEGEYTFKFKAYGQSPDDKPVKVRIKNHDTVLREMDIPPGEERKAQLYEAKVALPAGDQRLAVELVEPPLPPMDDAKPNNAAPANGNAPAAEAPKPRTLFVHYFELTGPADTRPVSHKKLLDAPADLPKPERTALVLRRLASRAYRRPATDEEVQRLTKLVERVEAEGRTWEAGIQLAVQAVLSSPKFLFRLELDERPAPPGDPRPLGDFSLASRLSYFLWASMPDDELAALAAAGELGKPEVLSAQVKRLLADKRSSVFVERFALQWLQLERLQTFAPDASMFPQFSDRLRKAMRQETILFMEAIVREDRSVLDLLDADFTFANGVLAAHYGVADTKGNAKNLKNPKDKIPGGRPIERRDETFHRIEFAGWVRGGLLTQAGILAVTSNPTRTSPVKRGRWVLEQILGAPPPPPPPNVPELDKPEDGKQLTGTLRQRMEQHRANIACANCHAKMDPLGFAFENFDAIGGWRDSDAGQPIDASGELPDGKRFQGPAELKKILRDKKDVFVRCLAEKLLTYAVGRGPEYYDRRALDQIVASTAAGEYKFSRLVDAIVQSAPFRLRRAEEPQP